MKNRWTIIFSIILILYAVTIAVTITAIVKVPSIYQNLQKNEYENIKSDIASILEISENQQEYFQGLEEKFAAEFAVLDTMSNNIVYSTFSVTTPEQLKGLLNPKAIGQEEAYTLTVNGVQYYIWIAQYHVSPQSIVDFWIKNLIIIIVTMVTLVVLLTVILLKRFLRPMKRLRENIWKISSYQLEKIQKNEIVSTTDYDVLSDELARFSQDLLQKMNQTGIKYNSLEKELYLKNEEAEYRASLLVEMAHDLKTPLQTALFEIEFTEKQNIDLVERRDLAKAKQKIEETLHSISDIIKVSYQTNMEQLTLQEDFDLILLLIEAIHNVSELMETKQFDVETNLDSELFIYTNRIRMKQLIHNALSNICNYTKNDSHVLISCYQEDNTLFLSFYNDAESLTDEQLEQAFTLFYRLSDSEYGTGIGLPTMKKIVEELAGTIHFSNKENGLELAFTFSMNTMKK